MGRRLAPKPEIATPVDVRRVVVVRTSRACARSRALGPIIRQAREITTRASHPRAEDGSGVRRDHPGHGPQGVPPRRPPVRGQHEGAPHGPQQLLRRRVRLPESPSALGEVPPRRARAHAVRPVAGLELRHGAQVHDGQRSARSHARAHGRAKYLEFKAVDGSYVFKGGKVYKVRSRATSGRTIPSPTRAPSAPVSPLARSSLTLRSPLPSPREQVPSTDQDALWSPLMGLFEKRRARSTSTSRITTRTTRRPTRAITSTWSPAASSSPPSASRRAPSISSATPSRSRRTIPTSTVPRVRW